MTDTQIVVACVIVLLLWLVAFFAMLNMTIDEVERKLGREMTTGEVIFWVFVATVVPSGYLIGAAYVWWIMPDARAANATMTAPAHPAGETGA